MDERLDEDGTHSMSDARRVANIPAGIDVGVRLSLNERMQHGVMFVSFTVLAISGFMVHLPRVAIVTLGLANPTVFEVRGTIHRISGIAMLVVSIYHVLYLLGTRRGRWQLREMLPRRSDWGDFRATMRHFRDRDAPRPTYGWYNYAEKAEYWALVWGTVIMALTGLILWLEELSPKIVIDVSAAVHRYEAILAVLAVVVWHMYHVHLSPEVFPTNPAWLTGKTAGDRPEERPSDE